MEEVKRKRGRPRKVVVETPPVYDDPISQQLHHPGGEFNVGDVGAFVLGTEIIYFRVRERVIHLTAASGSRVRRRMTPCRYTYQSGKFDVGVVQAV